MAARAATPAARETRYPAHMQTVASAFYRLEVHSIDHGLALKERADLADVLALVADLLAGPPRIVTADATRVALAGTTGGWAEHTPRPCGDEGWLPRSMMTLRSFGRHLQANRAGFT